MKNDNNKEYDHLAVSERINQLEDNQESIDKEISELREDGDLLDNKLTELRKDFYSHARLIVNQREVLREFMDDVRYVLDKEIHNHSMDYLNAKIQEHKEKLDKEVK